MFTVEVVSLDWSQEFATMSRAGIMLKINEMSQGNKDAARIVILETPYRSLAGFYRCGIRKGEQACYDRGLSPCPDLSL